MAPQVMLGVFRRLDNRFEGLGDDSPRALELHSRRRDALHEVFDSSESVQVLDWGNTNDTASHEYVELILSAVAPVAFSYVVVPGLRFLGNKLAEKAVDHATSEMVKAVVAWLRPKQEAKSLLDLVIKLGDGTTIQVDPPDRSASITITFSDGHLESVNYSSSSKEEIQGIENSASEVASKSAK
jgi:hypothetical protein